MVSSYQTVCVDYNRSEPSNHQSPDTGCACKPRMRSRERGVNQGIRKPCLEFKHRLRLAQETVRYRALPYEKLAQQMSILSPSPEEAMNGRLGLKQGRWKAAHSETTADNPVSVIERLHGRQRSE